MQKTLPLYLGPSVIGSVTLEWDEHRLFATAKTYASISGICRAYIKSGNALLLIGVLSPEDYAYTAKRTFTKEELSRAGMVPDEIAYAYAESKESAHSPETDIWQKANELPEILFQNKIATALAKSTGARINDTKKPSKIAVPLFTGRPFPRTDVLCLMTPYQIDGEIFGVIGISEDGTPKKL